MLCFPQTRWCLIATAMAASACGAGTGHTRAAATPNPGIRPVIEVVNRNYQRMEVTLKVGGRRFYLGDVPAFGTANFRIPAGASGSAARLALQAQGDVLFYDTPLVRFAGAQQLQLVIGANVRQSTLVARD
jgi:hypothetical protein